MLGSRKKIFKGEQRRWRVKGKKENRKENGNKALTEGQGFTLGLNAGEGKGKKEESRYIIYLYKFSRINV